MYEFFAGLATGFVEAAKIGFEIVVSIGNLFGTMAREAAEIAKEE